MKIKKAAKNVGKARELLNAVLEKADHLPHEAGELIRTAVASMDQAKSALAENGEADGDKSSKRSHPKALRSRRLARKST